MTTETTIRLPYSYTAPEGYSHGAHWSEPGRSGWYLVRDVDGQAIRVQARPDLLEVDQDADDFDRDDPGQMTPAEVRSAVWEAFKEHDRARAAELDLVVLETMPRQHRASHEAAGNRGRWPANGADRYLVPRAVALEVVEADPEWSEVVRDAVEADLGRYAVRESIEV
jgi:hypothetical protein